MTLCLQSFYTTTPFPEKKTAPSKWLNKNGILVYHQVYHPLLRRHIKLSCAESTNLCLKLGGDFKALEKACHYGVSTAKSLGRVNPVPLRKKKSSHRKFYTLVLVFLQSLVTEQERNG